MTKQLNRSHSTDLITDLEGVRAELQLQQLKIISRSGRYKFKLHLGWAESIGRLVLKIQWGTSLAVQGLRLHASTPGDIPLQEMWVWCLFRELRSHMLCGTAKKKFFLKAKLKKTNTKGEMYIHYSRVWHLCRCRRKEVKARLGRDDNSWTRVHPQKCPLARKYVSHCPPRGSSTTPTPAPCQEQKPAWLTCESWSLHSYHLSHKRNSPLPAVRYLILLTFLQQTSANQLAHFLSFSFFNSC